MNDILWAFSDSRMALAERRRRKALRARLTSPDDPAAIRNHMLACELWWQAYRQCGVKADKPKGRERAA